MISRLAPDLLVGLGAVQRRVLEELLAMGAARVSTLAKCSPFQGVQYSAVHRAMLQLEARGLVERIPESEAWRLSDAGRAAVARL